MKTILAKIVRKILMISMPELNKHGYFFVRSSEKNCEISSKAKLFQPLQIINSRVGDYTYISHNAIINNVEIGKFCAIGPNFVAGMGLHPTNGLSIAPMFYSSSNMCNGLTLCEKTKFEETLSIVIGNDVFIGANVTVLDGVNIGNGAIIGAGAVVSKDIPEYAIAVGVPIRIIKQRFSNEQIVALKRIKWWDWEIDKLREVEKFFFNTDEFINEYYK